ncbi:MAG: hypothetical protein J2P17_09240 [Mycobacterium sp.]|nr:hypothetical protein [Mycobacterium sp.]
MVWPGNDDVVGVGWPALADDGHTSPASADDDLGVDAAAVVLADHSDRLVVHRDQRGVDDPWVGDDGVDGLDLGSGWSGERQEVSPPVWQQSGVGAL